MKRTLAISILVLSIATALTGCGGSTSDGPGAPSPYRGNWSGTWASSGFGGSGTANVNISESGVITGTTTHTASGSVGDVNGTISDDGTVEGTVQYPGQELLEANGTWTINGAGHIVGELGRSDGTGNRIAFDLAEN